MSVPSPPHIVQTANGTSLPIVGWGPLFRLLPFMFPLFCMFSHFAANVHGHITYHGCRNHIILEVESYCVQDLPTGLLVGTG
jgi:hypothetical protein